MNQAVDWRLVVDYPPPGGLASAANRFAAGPRRVAVYLVVKEFFRPRGRRRCRRREPAIGFGLRRSSRPSSTFRHSDFPARLGRFDSPPRNSAAGNSSDHSIDLSRRIACHPVEPTSFVSGHRFAFRRTAAICLDFADRCSDLAYRRFAGRHRILKHRFSSHRRADCLNSAAVRPSCSFAHQNCSAARL